MKITAIRNQMIKPVAVISFIPKEETAEEDEEGLDKTELFVLATLNTIQKVLQEGFEYKDIVILTQKKSRNCNC
jgi:hypothetical protein